MSLAFLIIDGCLEESERLLGRTGGVDFGVCLPDSVKPQLTPHFLLYAVPVVTAELCLFSTLLLHLHGAWVMHPWLFWWFMDQHYFFCCSVSPWRWASQCFRYQYTQWVSFCSVPSSQCSMPGLVAHTHLISALGRQGWVCVSSSGPGGVS